MICLNTPLLIIASFLVLTLLVGIYFSRKKTTFREHAIGNKHYTTPTLVATVLATVYSGAGLLRTVRDVYNLGAYWIAITLITSLDAYLISRLALRMGPFMHHLSMAETVGSIYGKLPRVIAALVSVFCSVMAITMQITAMSKAIIMCIDTVNPAVAAVISTAVLIFYSTFGGVRAIIYTDILQLMSFCLIIPLLAWFMFIKTGKSTVEVISFLKTHTTKFSFNSLFYANRKWINMLLLIFSFLIARMYPAVIQRVYMAASPLQAKKVFSYVAFCNLIIWSIIILIGIFTFVGSPHLEDAKIWEYILATIPSIFKSFLAVSLLAMAMSTADSNLNSSAVMVINDIYLQYLKSGKTPSASDLLQLVKRATLVIGLLAMIIAFYCNNLVSLMYWMLDSYVPIVIAPFVLAIFGFRGTSPTALIGMASGLLTILAWNKWIQPKTGIDGAFVAMLANGLVMMVVHYIFNQPESAGWVRAAPDDPFYQMQQADVRKKAARKARNKDNP